MPVAPSSDSDKNSRPVGSAATTKKSDAVFKEYSKIKNFRFDIGGKWDDKNVCIFLPCYRETIKECNDYSKKNIDFWAKIAERGIASGGSRECFSSVNYCMELAERLKEFVQKYEKELQGVDVFEELKKDVSDLLPYFPPPEYGLIEKMKSRSVKAANNSTAVAELEGVELILKVCHRHLHRFGRSGQTYISVFASVSKEVTEISGVKTDVKPILENLKRGVIKTLSAEPDPVERARLFPEITKNFTVFDYVEPRDIKKKDYVPVETLPVLIEPRKPLKEKILTIPSKGNLKAVEAPPTSSLQEERMEVDDATEGSSTATELKIVSEKPETEEVLSDHSDAAGRMDGGEDHPLDTNVEVQPVVHVPRRRGRPKGALAKKYTRQDVSPMMTRALRRSKESGSETETNRNVHNGSSGNPMNPFVSIVRMPIQRQAVSTDSSKKNRSRKTYSQAESIVRRRKRTGLGSGEFIRPINNGFRGNTVDRTRRSFSPGNRSDGSCGSGRRRPRAGKISSPDLSRPIFSRQGASSIRAVEEEAAVPAHLPRSYHPSTYSARVNELPCAIESGTPWNRSVVPRGRSRTTGYNGGMENSFFRGDRDVYPAPSDFGRELILRYEDLEKKKLVVIQKMHSEVVHEMQRTNDLLEMLLTGNK